MASTGKTLSADKGRETGDGNAPSARSPAARRTEEEARQISTRMASAHKDAIDDVAKRNAKAHREAAERRAASERNTAQLRSSALAQRLKDTDRPS